MTAARPGAVRGRPVSIRPLEATVSTPPTGVVTGDAIANAAGDAIRHLYAEAAQVPGVSVDWPTITIRVVMGRRSALVVANAERTER